MKLRETTDGFVIEVTEMELNALQSGLGETLEALDDWEFQTRTGLERGEMKRIRDELWQARRQLSS